MTETWMPVSGTFREYPLEPVIPNWDYEPVIYSKGHHDKAEFLAAAQEEWQAETDEGVPIEYHDNTWTRAQGPVDVPRWLRKPAHVRHEWWATRCMEPMESYTHYTNPVAPWERGAYPVTVIDL